MKLRPYLSTLLFLIRWNIRDTQKAKRKRETFSSQVVIPDSVSLNDLKQAYEHKLRLIDIDHQNALIAAQMEYERRMREVIERNVFPQNIVQATKRED